MIKEAVFSIDTTLLFHKALDWIDSFVSQNRAKVVGEILSLLYIASQFRIEPWLWLLSFDGKAICVEIWIPNLCQGRRDHGPNNFDFSMVRNARLSVLLYLFFKVTAWFEKFDHQHFQAALWPCLPECFIDSKWEQGDLLHLFDKLIVYEMFKTGIWLDFESVKLNLPQFRKWCLVAHDEEALCEALVPVSVLVAIRIILYFVRKAIDKFR